MKNRLALFSSIFAVPSLGIWLAFLVFYIKLRIRSNSKQLIAVLAPVIGEKAAKEIAEIYKARLEEAFFESVKGAVLIDVFRRNLGRRKGHRSLDKLFFVKSFVY